MNKTASTSPRRHLWLLFEQPIRFHVSSFNTDESISNPDSQFKILGDAVPITPRNNNPNYINRLGAYCIKLSLLRVQTFLTQICLLLIKFLLCPFFDC